MPYRRVGASSLSDRLNLSLGTWKPRRGLQDLSTGFSPQQHLRIPLRAPDAIIVFASVFCYPLVRPAAEAAGYGYKARLHGLHRAMRVLCSKPIIESTAKRLIHKGHEAHEGE